MQEEALKNVSNISGFSNVLVTVLVVVTLRYRNGPIIYIFNRSVVFMGISSVESQPFQTVCGDIGLCAQGCLL